MRLKIFMTAVALAGLIQTTQALDWYVATNGTGLGTNGWAFATNDLQGAITASAGGDTIWVSNGIYASGGISNYPSGNLTSNRIAITKAVTVRSKDNNPTNTIIKGNWDPATTNGPAAVRCVYMSAGSLIGFTLTNGATVINASPGWMSTHFDICGGGVMCPNTTTAVISNCIITGNSAYGGPAVYYGGGGAWFGTFYNCSFIGNRAVGAPGGAYGGGTANSILYNCELIGNLAYVGGGCSVSTLSNCALMANTAIGGGGSHNSTLYDCSLISNQATANYGGGAYASTLRNCKLKGNTAPSNMSGGGAYESTLYNCLLTGNLAGYGGGAGMTAASKLYNCTLVGNYANGGPGAGGAYGGTLSNCVVYYNGAANAHSNWTGCTFVNSFTSSNAPGVGNITGDPMLTDKGSGFGTNHVEGNYRLAARSPCVNAGTNLTWMTDGSITSRDLDGKQRVRYGTVDMGAYEHIRAGTVYGVR